ncbi:unnamed protein product [Paramecium primaurelia]|uniref:WD40-repeat-containing domain n=1 Tax=Paramecium primaurelia TaxID=5886 RepID=A0A8S1NPY6_PARPR|nr:unnamed protein product [Paramecium primaurelia]
MLDEDIMIFCPIHNYEIVFLDIHEGIPLGERACCKGCCNIKKAYNIKEAKNKINSQRLLETQIINTNIDKIMEEMNFIEKKIKSFYKEIQVVFNEVFLSIENQKIQLQSQANIENEIKIKSLSDLQNLALMICQLENNQNNNLFQFKQLDMSAYLTNLQNKLEKVQNIVDQYMTTIKATKIDSEQQIVFRNNYQVIQTYQMDKWIDPILFQQDNNKAIICDCSGIMEINFENSKFINQRLIQINNITGICFEANLNLMIIASQDALISIWQKENQNWHLRSQYKGHSQSINKIIINESKSQVISAGLDHKIVIWNRKELKLEKQISLKEHKKSVTSLAWNYSGEYFASGSADKSIIIWKSNNGQWSLHQQISDKHQELISDIVFDDYDNIYTAAENVYVWKLDNSKNYIFYLKIQTQNQVKKLFYNKNHQYLIILQKTIEIWKIVKDQIVHKQSINGEYYNQAISINGQFILAQKYKNQELELFELKQL